MTLRIALFILSVAALAAFGLFTQAKAQVQACTSNGVCCTGIIGCIIAQQMEAKEQQEEAQEGGPYPCNVWNGREYVRAMCSP